MRVLIIGIGALGGVIAARLLAGGHPVRLAVRDAAGAGAERLRAGGLRVTGIGGDVSAKPRDVAPLGEHLARGETFDLAVLATKAHDAIAAAPDVVRLLGPGGVLLPIQNGGVSEMLAERIGAERVIGGLSNLGATMVSPGVYEQRNAGHLLIGELGSGGDSARAERVRAWLGHAVEVRVTRNMRGAIWSKLLLNCSVTTLGAVAGRTMREYIGTPEGRRLFDLAYAEALAVARASGATPERMLVDPVPPREDDAAARERWLGGVLDAYGDLKPSMLQDFERGRTTEIDFINGYVADLGRRLGVATPVNTAITETVRAISRGELRPGLSTLEGVLRSA